MHQLIFRAAFRTSAVRALRDNNANVGLLRDCSIKSAGMRDGGSGRLYALLALAAVKRAAIEHTPVGIFFHKLAHVDRWYPKFDELTSPVVELLGRVKMAAGAAAGPLGPIVGGMSAARQTGNGLFDLFTAALLASTAGGAALGGLNWHFNRSVREDDAETEGLAAQADLYKQMRREIETEAGLKPPAR